MTAEKEKKRATCVLVARTSTFRPFVVGVWDIARVVVVVAFKELFPTCDVVRDS